MSKLVRYFAVAVGAFLLVLGLWAFFSPRTFYEQIALWPPYNKHLFHDVGSFQAGLGAAVIAAAFVKDSLLVGLIGAGAGSVIHAISHIIDRGTGGRATDPAALSILALLIVIAAVLRAREVAGKT